MQQSAGGGETILVVDDERYIVRILEFNLSKAGYKVLTAFDGEQALHGVREEMPDLILADVMMPGMDGFELCSRLKGDEATAGIPVVLLTAKGEEKSRETGLQSGAEKYITKPFSPKQLLKEVRDILDRS